MVTQYINKQEKCCLDLVLFNIYLSSRREAVHHQPKRHIQKDIVSIIKSSIQR